MDLRKIKKLIELVDESGIAELEVRSGEEAVRIVRNAGTPVAVAAPAEPAPVADVAEKAGPAPAAVPASTVSAPMAGTFYTSPEPDADPFVSVGSQVEPGQVLCIIESMKMMNEIKAETSGTVSAVLVENGQPIATGQALFALS